MLSSGGIAPAEEAATAGAWSVLSGPAGGAIGAGLLARLSGDGHALGFDMGGTSCDVCVVESGRVRKTDSRRLGGRVIQLPMVDVHTVGAGGGSIGWRDSGGALRVGPRSAGADPGPAAYGRGGTEPTVTDANLALGYLGPGSSLAGGVELDHGAADRALAGLGEELGLDRLEVAEGIVRVANQEMVRALRVVTVERGVDPRGFALLPFGGAGPMHAAAIAVELGIDRILCPRASGVLSALGLLASERRRDTAHTVMLRGGDLTAERIAAEVAALREPLARGLDRGRVEVGYELRYRGQAFELGVEGGERPEPEELIEAFAAEHERRYGYRNPDAEVELVGITVAVIEPGPDPRPHAAPAGGIERGSRRARFGGDWLEAETLRGEPAAGVTAAGPCVFELPEATLVLPPGWRAEVDDAGTIVAERASEAGRSRERPRPGLAAGPGRRAAGGLRRDGRDADPLGLLAQHHRAPRLLDRAVRRFRGARHAGRAHPGPPRLDARRGRRRARLQTAARRRLDPQRPLSRWHPPARRDPDLAPVQRRGRRATRVRGEPRPPRRHRWADPWRDAGGLDPARPGGGRDRAEPRDRRAPARARRADAPPRGAARRPARPARGEPDRGAPRRGAGRAARARAADCRDG